MYGGCDPVPPARVRKAIPARDGNWNPFVFLQAAPRSWSTARLPPFQSEEVARRADTDGLKNSTEYAFPEANSARGRAAFAPVVRAWHWLAIALAGGLAQGQGTRSRPGRRLLRCRTASSADWASACTIINDGNGVDYHAIRTNYQCHRRILVFGAIVPAYAQHEQKGERQETPQRRTRQQAVAWQQQGGSRNGPMIIATGASRDAMVVTTFTSAVM